MTLNRHIQNWHRLIRPHDEALQQIKAPYFGATVFHVTQKTQAKTFFRWTWTETEREHSTHCTTMRMRMICVRYIDNASGVGTKYQHGFSHHTTATTTTTTTVTITLPDSKNILPLPYFESIICSIRTSDLQIVCWNGLVFHLYHAIKCNDSREVRSWIINVS